MTNHQKPILEKPAITLTFDRKVKVSIVSVIGKLPSNRTLLPGNPNIFGLISALIRE